MSGGELGGTVSGGESSSGPWQAALEEAWDAYLHGSYPIGACVVNAEGQVVSRGRNRLGEARHLNGVISGHRLGHAEVNALLALPDLSADECRRLTLYTTVEPCPMCLGAMLMQRLPALAYAAADPWAGHTDALSTTFYPSQKRVTVSRAPEQVQRACTLLLLTSFLDGEMPRDHGFFLAHGRTHPELMAAARRLSESGALAALRARQAGLDEALDLLGAGYRNLSPGLERTGRACACVLHEGKVLMLAVRGGRWTLPGGGIEPGETAAQAAAREAWEECGAHIVVEGEPFPVTSPHNGETSQIFLARLTRQEPSPEGRASTWADPTQAPWSGDYQLLPALAVLRQRGWL